jgi:hypothetical protein
VRRVRKKATRRPLFSAHQCVRRIQAAFNHIEVSNALLIKGIFMPKLVPAAALAAGFDGFSAMLGVSVARSQEPSSCERATEKNRST